MFTREEMISCHLTVRFKDFKIGKKREDWYVTLALSDKKET